VRRIPPLYIVGEKTAREYRAVQRLRHIRCVSLIREAYGLRRIPPLLSVVTKQRGNTAQSKAFATPAAFP
jgi:hypothetical protein